MRAQTFVVSIWSNILFNLHLEATVLNLQQLYFICSNFLICSTSLVGHSTGWTIYRKYALNPIRFLLCYANGGKIGSVAPTSDWASRGLDNLLFELRFENKQNSKCDYRFPQWREHVLTKSLKCYFSHSLADLILGHQAETKNFTLIQYHSYTSISESMRRKLELPRVYQTY